MLNCEIPTSSPETSSHSKLQQLFPKVPLEVSNHDPHSIVSDFSRRYRLDVSAIS
jgi:hypothetical protein